MCNSTASYRVQMLSSYFDITTAGSKTDAKSYEKITEAIGHKPGEILFLTDIAAGKWRQYGKYWVPGREVNRVSFYCKNKLVCVTEHSISAPNVAPDAKVSELVFVRFRS